MFPYTFARFRRILRETVALITSPQVTLNRTRYVVVVEGAMHHVRRDGVCDCGGTPESPCSAIPLVRDHLAAGGARPLGRHPDTWPRTWLQIPSHCPICDCPTIPDRHLDSQAGPGWRCSLTNCRHFWMIRMEPLRRFLATNPLKPCHPWVRRVTA